MKFPGLISGCTIDWFQKWPEDARVAVSNFYLESFEIVCSNEVKTEVINIMSYIHAYVEEICAEYYDRFRRQTYVTPKSLISFLECYKRVYQEKRENILEMAQRMTNGLKKLEEAAESVKVLEVDLIAKVRAQLK